MRRLTLFILLTCCAGLISFGALAQGAPAQIEDALAAFNQRLGLNLTLNDFNWSWSQDNYRNTSLGCPQAGQSYAQVTTVGYRFLFTWQGRVYDYRVSADRTIVVFCGSSEVSMARDPALSNSLCVVPSDDIIYIRTRLVPGIQARVTPPLPNNLRSLPASTETLIGEIPGGATFQVLNGPSCDAEGFIWWEVAYENLQGWTAEGRDLDYFIEPLPPASLPLIRTRITTDNLAALGELARLQGNYAESLAWSPGNDLVTIGAAGSEGLWVYPLDALEAPPRTLPSTTRFTRVTFTSASERALVGDVAGSLRLWDIAPNTTTIERIVLQGHDNPLTAVAFNPDGVQVASAGGYTYGTPEEDSNKFAIALWDIDTVSQLRLLRGHTGDVVALAYSPDGTLLASASQDGSVRVWDITNGSEVGVLNGDAAATALAFDPNGTRLLTGWDDGAVIAITISDFAVDEPLFAHTGGVTGLAFSPDGLVLASVGEDGRAIVWEGDTQTVLPDSHNGIVHTVAFSPDGTLLATLGVDNTIRLWGVVPNP